MSGSAPREGVALLRAERQAFRRRVLQVAAAILVVLGPVFALSEWSEQTTAHNLILLSFVPVGLTTIGLIRFERQREAVGLLLAGAVPVIGWVHISGRRVDTAILYLVPLLVMAMITSDRRSARWIPVGVVCAATLLRIVHWFTGPGDDFGRWTTQSFDVVAMLGITGGLVWMSLARMGRDEGILRSTLSDRERLAELARIANDEKSAFLARVSHELRTPLNAILGYAELLDEEEAVDTDHQEDLQRIHHAGSQLLGLIDAVLDLSKVEAGRLELHVERTDIAALVESVRGTAAPLLLRNDNTLEVRHEGPDHAMLDGTRVTQVLLNLLSNAARFTRSGTVVLTIRSEVGVVVFEVSDTGIGIPADRIGVLFQPFVQASALTARDYGGTGLGLALCERFVRHMGGHIEVESVEGEGSTFRVTLPDGQEAPTDSHPS